MEGAIFGQVDIQHFAALFAIEMPVFAHVRTKTDGGTIENDLADETAFDEDAQAIVNSRERNFGVGVFGPFENLFGGRMIMAFSNDVEDLLALTGHAQTAGGEALGKSFIFVDVHRLTRFVEGYVVVRRVVK